MQRIHGDWKGNWSPPQRIQQKWGILTDEGDLIDSDEEEEYIPESDNELNISNKKVSNNTEELLAEDYNCQKCDSEFSYERTLKIHMKNNHEGLLHL